MTESKNHREQFKDQLLGHDLLVGTFQKTPSPIVAEVLGLTALDVICLDAEHAPFDRKDTDSCIAALRAAEKPCIVRTQSASATEIRNVLDCGASGIVVPHVQNANEAETIVKAAMFGEGGRGYAGSTRAADYTQKAMPAHLAASQVEISVIVQIEDLAALPHVADIAGTAGVDAVFIGRVDLAVAMGKDVSDPAVIDAVRDICITARGCGTSVGMFTPDLTEIPNWQQEGASFFLLGSEHNFMLSGAASLLTKTKGD